MTNTQIVILGSLGKLSLIVLLIPILYWVVKQQVNSFLTSIGW